MEGQENIPKDGAFVLCCNHISLLDPPVVGAACTRKIHWMAKEELFVPVLGTIYKWLGAFPVKRGTADRTAITHGINILKNNLYYFYHFLQFLTIYILNQEFSDPFFFHQLNLENYKIL